MPRFVPFLQVRPSGRASCAAGGGLCLFYLDSFQLQPTLAIITVAHCPLNSLQNEKGRTSLLAHLKEQIEKAERLDVFVGYFYMDGFVLIRDSLKDLKKIRIFIGSVDDNIYKEIKEARKQQSSDKNRKGTLLDWLKSGDLDIKACHTSPSAKLLLRVYFFHVLVIFSATLHKKKRRLKL